MTEALVSMLLISIIGLAATCFAGASFKTAYDRDMQIISFLHNLSIVERLKAEVTTLPQLYTFSQNNSIKIILIDRGEVTLTGSEDDITVNPIFNENFAFSDKLQNKSLRLFRIEVGGELPNSKLITVLRLEDDDDG